MFDDSGAKDIEVKYFMNKVSNKTYSIYGHLEGYTFIVSTGDRWPFNFGTPEEYLDEIENIFTEGIKNALQYDLQVPVSSFVYAPIIEIELPTDNVAGIDFLKVTNYAINWQDYYEYKIYQNNDGYFCEYSHKRDDGIKILEMEKRNSSVPIEKVDSWVNEVNDVLNSGRFRVQGEECPESFKKMRRSHNEMGDLRTRNISIRYKDGTNVSFDELNRIVFNERGEMKKYCAISIDTSSLLRIPPPKLC